MRKPSLTKVFIVALFAIMLSFTSAFANKTSVTLVAPGEVAKGNEATITINVAHKGNTKMHYTEWVSLSINGEEVKRWEFTKENLPEAQEFKLTYKIKAEGTMKIKAQANCNMHGSAGEKSATISVK